MATLPILPAATGQSYTIPNVRKGFIYNKMLDSGTTSIACFSNLLNTFRGNLEGTCLADKQQLMDLFFEEMYLNGTIGEHLFDLHQIPKDVDSTGQIIDHPTDISQEN